MKLIYSVYLWLVGFLYFVFFLIFALVVSYILPASKYNTCLQKILRFFLKIMRITVKVEWAQNIDPEKHSRISRLHQRLCNVPGLFF